MRFSVVIPTRQRPVLLEQALRSVLAQQDVDVEVVVVVDGATGVDLVTYQSLAAAVASDTVRWVWLPHRPLGHGPSFVRNTGAATGTGEYLAFLDDDDLWTDAQHLSTVRKAVQRHGPIDLYMAAQKGQMPDGAPHPGPLWLDDVANSLGPAVDEFGHRLVAADQLARGASFSHLNVTVFRSEFFLSLGGLDELLRYEEDLDVFLRGVDAARLMAYRPSSVALHRIPAPRAGAQASAAGDAVARRLQQLRIFDKCLLQARHASLRRRARKAKAHLLGHLADLMRQAGRPDVARIYGLQALALRTPWPTFTRYRES